MPQDHFETLTNEEVDGLTIYLTFKNKIIAEDEIKDAKTIPLVIIPARDHFVLDNRREGNEIC